ncbi:MAG TPA: hypothetical protein VHG91_07385 [Longimicrobium sp.]|nr:hypothetical protein [Longimicrobium sp.]
MKKLGLRLEALKVQSFNTGDPAPSPWDGEAVADAPSEIDFTMCTCTCPPWW